MAIFPALTNQTSALTNIGSSDTLQVGGGVLFPIDVSSPLVSQVAKATDTLPQDLTLKPQDGYASATGSNRKSGSLVVNIGAPTNGSTTEARLIVKRSGTFVAALGPYEDAGSLYSALYLGPSLAPSSTNYSVVSDGVSLYMNSPAGGSIFLAINGTIATAYTGPEFLWAQTVGSPGLTQSARISDSLPSNFTITPQFAFNDGSTAGANRKAGDLVVNVGIPVNGGTAEARLTVKRDSVFSASIGPYETAGNVYSAAYLGPGITPSATNFCFLGDGVGNSYLNVPTGGNIVLSFAGSGASAGSLVVTAASGIAWAAATVAPILSQSDLTTASGTGATLTIQAQNETGTTSIGGDLNLTSGTGTSAAGNVHLQVGGVTRFTVASNGVLTAAGDLVVTGLFSPTTFSTNIAFAAAQSAPTIKQNDLTTGSGTGQTLTIQAQNETGATSIGGSLVLTAGTGTSTGGNVDIRSGVGGANGIVFIRNGGTITHSFGATYFQMIVSDFLFNSAISNPAITYSAKSSPGGTGNNLTIKGQNVSGAGTTGGAIDIQSGTGTTTDGYVYMRTGSTVKFTIDNVKVSLIDPIHIDTTNTGLTRIGALPGALTYGALHCGTAAVNSPTVSNYAFASNGADTALNGTANSRLVVAGTSIITCSSSAALFLQPILLAGGVNVASDGYIRAPAANGGTSNILYARNNNNSGDLPIIRANSADYIVIGDAGTALNISFQCGSGGVFDFYTNAAYWGSFGATDLNFSNTSDRKIYQLDKTTGSGVGQTLTIQAQNETGTTSVGGGLTLTSGTGTSSAGAVLIQTGGTLKFAVQPTYFELYQGTLGFVETTTPLIEQFQTAVNNATGATFTIQAQNSVTGTTIGGGLTLTSGTGTSVAGNVLVQTGGVTALTISPTLITNTLPIVLQGASSRSTVGDIRAINNTTIIAARNAADGGDLVLVSTTNADHARFGIDAGNNCLDIYSVDARMNTGGSTAQIWTSSLTTLTVPLVLKGSGTVATDGYIRAYSVAAGAGASTATILAVHRALDAGTNTIIATDGYDSIIMPGVVREIRFTTGTSATYSSTTYLPTGAYVVTAQFKIVQSYSNGATISVGQTGSASAFMTTSDINAQGTAGDIYAVEEDVSAPSVNPILVTIGGSPAAGSGICIVRYCIPHT